MNATINDLLNYIEYMMHKEEHCGLTSEERYNVARVSKLITNSVESDLTRISGQ